MFIGALGLLLGNAFESAWLSYLMLCVAAVGVYAPFGVWWSYPTTFLTGSAAAGAIGMINSFGNTGGFVGPYITGFLKEMTGGYAGGWAYLGLSDLVRMPDADTAPHTQESVIHFLENIFSTINAPPGRSCMIHRSITNMKKYNIPSKYAAQAIRYLLSMGSCLAWCVASQVFHGFAGCS